MSKVWLILRKKEMTKLWIGDNFEAVTLLKLVPQEIIRHKTTEKDWYDAVVVWVEKKNLKKEKWIKTSYSMVTEFKVTPDQFDKFKSGLELDVSVIDGIETATLRWVSKWKWYQWVVKRYWFAGWPETHGSKFHRLPGSIGNRKPRRVNKWHPLPWHMWIDTISLKNRKIVEKYDIEWESIIVVKGSVPWAYNSLVRIEIN